MNILNYRKDILQYVFKTASSAVRTYCNTSLLRSAFGLLLVLCCATLFAQDQTLIHCGKLIDGYSDEVQTRMTIIIKGNKILRVEEGYVVAKGNVKIIDLKDKTVLPGLMDMHVHLEGEMTKKSYSERFTDNPSDIAFKATVFAERTLMAGFTTVRDLGGSGVNISLRNAINKGLIKGPRVYTAGKSIAITGGHADPTNGWRWDLMGDPGPDNGVANGVDECRKAVRAQVKKGSDLIKITATGGVLSVAKDGFRPQFTEDEIMAIVETADDFGIHVAAHCHGAEGMKRAIRAGVKTIEHGTLMDAEVMKLMKQYGTYYVPTITAGKAVADSAKIPNYYPDVVTPKAEFIGPKIQETFGKAYKAGVKIAFGTDAGVFKHGLNWLEFKFMMEAGMPAMEAIKSATMVAAEVLGIEHELGSIEE
ncbi:MAG: amidohydrolase family protein, partial [Bacteroidia bacterium]|nr:amidohydrolase family protein [Bacteroidia bacterium]